MAIDLSTHSCIKITLAVLVPLLAYFHMKYKNDDSGRLENVLIGLLKEEKAGGELPTDLSIAVGLGSCLDIIVDGIPVMNALGIATPEKPKYHDNMLIANDVAEMFALYLSQGAAAERFIPLALLKELVAVAEKVNGSRWAAGGNAPVISNRFAREGFTDVYVGAPKSEKFNKLYPSKLNFVGKTTDDDDIHLIMEFRVGDKWGNYTVTRANRFVVHSDQINPYMESLEDFDQVIQKVNPRLVVIGGLQMLDNFPFKEGEREDRMQTLSQVLKDIPATTLIHFEMASFAEVDMMQSILDNIFPYVDSLGMNEQELPNIISMVQEGRIIEVADSNPRTAVILDNMRKIYDYYTENSVRKLTRIHVHTLAFQAILVTKSSPWKNSRAGSARASLTAHRHVCGDDDIDFKKTRLIMDDSFAVSADSTERIVFNETSPISCWDEKDYEICVAPVLVCTQVKQTVGGGDNITPAGLMPQI